MGTCSHPQAPQHALLLVSPSTLTCRKSCEHAQSRTGDAEHVGQGEADEDADSDDQARNDGRLVAQSQPEDDVSGCTSLASIGHILHTRRASGNMHS